ncbi:MAG TPA: 4-hydroxybenzoate 3-monooxygenase [Acidimicrobiia bacterium]|nr:4-hydroxybenzoate 3-monooxygenase [Acidimicrobiia bacterium]
MRTQVAIIGGGPAGSLLSILLGQAGIESVIVEHRTREYVLSRIRAGVLEKPSVEGLDNFGLGERMQREGFVHRGINLAFLGRLLRIDFDDLVHGSVTVYGQTELQKDLYRALDMRGGTILDEAEEVELHDVDGPSPHVTFRSHGEIVRLDCEFIAGCDGSHGISRDSIPAALSRTYERTYPFGWLGILSETPPVSGELIYANHPRGFALCSMRNENLSRYYLQCDLETNIEEWPDQRFWDELRLRLPDEPADTIVIGASIEKSITPLRSFVFEPMQHGNLFLAGDSAHVMPPTGAKGLNMAIADVFLLSDALIGYYREGTKDGLGHYSETALRRVWKVIRFSWWMTGLMHRLETEGELGQKIQEAELEYLASSRAAQTALAENYTGLPLR